MTLSQSRSALVHDHKLYILYMCMKRAVSRFVNRVLVNRPAHTSSSGFGMNHASLKADDLDRKSSC